ncbi:G-type lectin S-receptor-like serine/threonine-protein kinase At4g27290 [Lotus japonicus]|uniref:G-type lectin S-receptor-like serine/threonine-protein kinase At4g27290 n=1 Tax=Lotus japonicus TaxID=34305 RepID=UPI00258C6308|nr:G-type lectin S-receptor-like serine/threonine-protein kinase At4g27290 [Lotus japonicus]
MESFKVLVLCSFLLHFMPSIDTLDTIVPGQSVKDDKTLVSAEGSFEAGFFNFGDPNRQYFGICYKDISPRTFVWVANRDSPLGNSSGILNVTDGGNLVILDATNVLVWSSNTSTTAKKPVVQLLESGNLVVREESNPENLLWQSFDLPGDTLLAGMKIRSNLKNGKYTSLVSWKDTENPAAGEYSYHIDTRGYPQLVVTKEDKLFFRIGPWNGNTYSGIPSQTLYRSLNFSFVITDQEVVYGYELLNKSTITRFILTTSGQSARYILSDQTKSWQFLFAGPSDQCENYGLCGANSNCDSNATQLCECLPGFIPKSQEDWNSQRWDDGCVRRVNLEHGPNDGFLKYAEMKLPDTSASWFHRSMKLEECEKFCLKNCSCSAYASLDIRDGGSGCLLWFNNIMDLRKLNSGGQDLYIRVAASEYEHNKGLNKMQLAGVLVGCSIFAGAMIILGMALLWKKKLKKSGKSQILRWKSDPDNKEDESIDIPIFELSTIAKATNNFSTNNKLGEGGFGPVYKGTWINGQDIAVKRLCDNSGQGPKEFINEVELIAHLQHRNLVKLLGCCIQNDERILIYEFMINRSLDYFIFDQTRKSSLLWAQRFQIICGIAKGVLYLHEDSRLRIIHRDLKASNILLDENLNPKISDFGLARTFGGDEAGGKTKSVAGTYGYISPEYAARGHFSVKSDVFSYGVILLEIVSGKKNTGYFDHHDLHLLGHAWRLWCEQMLLELIDESLGDSIALAEQEVLRCIQTGLLCVQDRPEDRPDMSAVVLMLNGEKPLPRPKEPAFYPRHLGSSLEHSKLHSNNEISMSLLKPR